MKFTVVRKHERVPTPCFERDGSLGGWARREASEDGIVFTGLDPFLSLAELREAIEALEKPKRGGR